MVSKKTSRFKIDGKEKVFNFFIFNEIFLSYQEQNKISGLKLESKLSEYLEVSSDCVHNWRFRLNGPSSIDTIKRIASFFELDDFNILLSAYNMSRLSGLQLEEQGAINRIYNAVIDYMFTATLSFDELNVRVLREYFLLREYEFYSNIMIFISDTMYSKIELDDNRKDKKLLLKILSEFCDILEGK